MNQNIKTMTPQETWRFVNENLTVQAIIFSKKANLSGDNTDQNGDRYLILGA